MFAAVDVRIEPDALVLDVVELCEGKHLKSAAVGEDGPVPIHKFVKPSRLFNEFVPGAHVQVIGVGEDDLRPRLFQIAREHPLDGRLRADGHVDGRLDVAVRGVKYARTGARGGVGLDHFKGKQICQTESSWGK